MALGMKKKTKPDLERFGADTPRDVERESSRRLKSGWFAGGVLVLTLAGLLGGLVFARNGSERSVWVASGDLARGHVIGKGDIVEVKLPLTVDVVGLEADVALDGRVLAVDLREGGFVSDSTP